MLYFYIHGFNSGPQSRSGRELEHLLQEPVIRCNNDYSQPWQTCMTALSEFIIEQAGNSDACIMGTSLGGFYAMQLRLPCIVRVAAWNPVVFPALQLAKFTGENVRFTDGVAWNFSREALLSYAAAPDAREWKNFAWNASQDSGTAPARKVFIGARDDVLDHEVGLNFWLNHADVELIDSGHSIADFSHSLSFIKPEQR